MGILCFNFIFVIGFLPYLDAGTLERIYIRDNKPALKGSDIQLVCEISHFTNSDILYLYKSNSKLSSSFAGITSLSQCLPSLCLTTAIGRYSFSADNSNVFINITGINRLEDQKWWTCVVGNQRKDMLLTVISVPEYLKYINPSNHSQDLTQTAVQLKCSTGCSYPQPTITWHYSESGNDSLQAWSSSGTVTDTTSGCSDSERKYSSTLTLPKFTTFPGNLQKTIQFKCSIQSFTGMTQPLYTHFSTDVLFAVKVSSAVLKDETDTVSGQLDVNIGVNKTLTCNTDVSRPAAMIVWYIGTEEKQRSNTNDFIFTPEITEHNKQLFCKAFNIQKESEAVHSYKVTLYVQVQVSSATLMDGPTHLSGQLHVEIGEKKTLTCDTGVSRPAAMIVWYIGTKERQRSTSNTFIFNPESSGHSKQVYCKAFNIQPENEAVSSNKSTIDIKGMPSNPSLLYYIGQNNDANTFIFVGGYNGGRLQSFVIETERNGTNNWIEQVRFNETDTRYLENEESLYRFDIIGMVTGVYNIRVLAGNKIGWLSEDLAPTIQFTVKRLVPSGEQEQLTEERSDNTAAIVGGALSAIIVGILVAGIFIMRRMTWKKEDKKTSDIIENIAGPTYDSLQAQQQEMRTTYSTLTHETGPGEVARDKTYENVESHLDTSCEL